MYWKIFQWMLKHTRFHWTIEPTELIESESIQCINNSNEHANESFNNFESNNPSITLITLTSITQLPRYKFQKTTAISCLLLKI